jgi:hypothetical protein
VERAAGRLGLPAGALTAARTVAVRPALWRPALRQARALAPGRWWRRWPFLPLPDRRWMEFRLVTAYGDARAAIVPEDLVAWLAWSDTVRPQVR